MIRLTRLNHQPIVVNAELIESLEAAPDTMLSLINGQKMTVRESVEEVLARVLDYQRAIRQGPASSPQPGEGPA